MDFKHGLLQTAATLQLPAASFRAANITEWEPIMKRIEDTFVQARYDTRIWWWTCFKSN